MPDAPKRIERGVHEVVGLTARGGLPVLLAVDSRGEAVEVAFVPSLVDYEKEVRRLERRLDAVDPDPGASHAPTPRGTRHA